MKAKKCGNCEHFCNYYIKTKSYLRKTATGCCKSPGTPWRKRKSKTEEDTACERWSSNEHVEEDRKEHIYFALIEMAKRVEEIALILKSDE